MGDLDDLGILEQREHNLVLRTVDGGREQQRLAFGGDGIDDFADLRPKAHVEHAVGLVEDELLNVAEPRRALAHEVEQAPRRRDDDVGAGPELLDLRAVSDAAEQHDGAVVRAAGDGRAGIGDLLRKLARRRHDDHERTFVVGSIPQLVQGGKGKCGRLAGAGLGGCDEVAPFEHDGDGLLLNRGRLGIPEVDDGRESLLGKSEVIESSYDVLLVASAFGSIPPDWIGSVGHPMRQHIMPVAGRVRGVYTL